MFAGVLVGFGLFTNTSVSTHLYNLGLGQSTGAASAIVGGGLGIPVGFLAVVKFLFIDHPLQAVLELVSGALVSAVIVVITACFERTSLRLRGYRRLSQDEVRQVAPLVKEVAEAMDLPALPRFVMDDSVIPNAYTQMRTVVITKGLLQTLDAGEIRAILAHELQHWQAGDSVALHFVWAASLPAVLVYKFGGWMAGGIHALGGREGTAARTLLGFVGWFVAWPAGVLIRLVLIPTIRGSQRRCEYQADQAAAAIGLAPQMISALHKMSAFESGRTGWEAALSATHPPTELRIEALEPPRPDDWEYQEEDLSGPNWPEVRRVFGGLRGVARR
jgi:Zn-dependent protease with chaperone function